MCGIAGFINSFSRPDSPEDGALVRGMTRRLTHRGPDEEGYWQSPDDRIHLGHRRLSIIDLTPTGRQPMATPDGRHVLCYNGEIYNYPELRAELESRGVRFAGTSDTEVLLYALVEWGVEPALRKLNGMFAFAYWEGPARKLWLARDRLGEKPLYYGMAGDRFVFGSELKALTAVPEFPRDINRTALALLLRHNYIPCPESIYTAARKLPPGHCLAVVPDGRMEECRPAPYWRSESLLTERTPLGLAPGDPALVNLCEDVLRRAVRQRMVADVPLGALLSGGIDSSMVVALMQGAGAGRTKTYTIGYAESDYNEAKDAAAVARHLGTDHHEYIVSSREALDVIARLPEIYDEPFADASQVPTHLVARFARAHVTVALSGDGGDEMFGGYNRYVWSARVWPGVERTPFWLRNAGRISLEQLTPDQWNALGNMLNPVLPQPYRVRGFGSKLYKFAQACSARTVDELYAKLITYWQNPEKVVLPPHPVRGFATFPAGPAAGLVERMMFLDLNGYLPDDILCKVDRASMACSLETRAPFLNNDLARFAWNLPADAKVRGGTGKWLLREVLKRHVPEAMFDRPKTGFGIPLRDWLRGPMQPWAEDLLDEARLRREGYFDERVVRACWAEHQSGRRNQEYALWSVLMFQAWLGRQENTSPAPAPVVLSGASAGEKFFRRFDALVESSGGNRRDYVKKVDAWSIRLVVQPLSIPITEWFYRYPAITPNGVTLLSFLVTMVGAYCYFLGGWGWLAVGALIWQFGYILDGVDGKLARKRGMSSAFGEYLDKWLDKVKKILSLAALIYSSSHDYRLLGGLVVLHYVLQRTRYTPSRTIRAFLNRHHTSEIFDPLDAMFFIFVLGPLFNRFFEFLVLTIAYQLTQILVHWFMRKSEQPDATAA